MAIDKGGDKKLLRRFQWESVEGFCRYTAAGWKCLKKLFPNMMSFNALVNSEGQYVESDNFFFFW